MVMVMTIMFLMTTTMMMMKLRRKMKPRYVVEFTDINEKVLLFSSGGPQFESTRHLGL